MKILSTILVALAVVFVGCAHPIDETEATAEAVGAFDVHNDASAIKDAITNGATYNPSNKCLVVSGVDNYPRITDGVWSLSTSSAAPSHRLNAVVFDRIAVGDILSGTPGGEYDNVLHVPADVYLPNQEYTTESESWHTVDSGSISGVAHVVLGAP